MANPSLKAQIEAAKSALASGLAAPSAVAPLATQPDHAQNTPNRPFQNEAQQDGAQQDGAKQDGAKPAHATSAAALDDRITRLEGKLAENQRDLHRLLQKIREVSRLQAQSGQTATAPANTETAAHPRRYKAMIMLAMAVVTGLAIGIIYFLATDNHSLSTQTAPSWISTIIDSFSG